MARLSNQDSMDGDRALHDSDLDIRDIAFVWKYQQGSDRGPMASARFARDKYHKIIQFVFPGVGVFSGTKLVFNMAFTLNSKSRTEATRCSYLDLFLQTMRKVMTMKNSRVETLEGVSRYEFETLLQPHSRRLYRTALIMTKSTGQAKDLLRQTYLTAWRGYAKANLSNIGVWLSSLLVREFINSHRRSPKLNNGQAAPSTSDPHRRGLL